MLLLKGLRALPPPTLQNFFGAYFIPILTALFNNGLIVQQQKILITLNTMMTTKFIVMEEYLDFAWVLNLEVVPID